MCAALRSNSVSKEKFDQIALLRDPFNPFYTYSIFNTIIFSVNVIFLFSYLCDGLAEDQFRKTNRCFRFFTFELAYRKIFWGIDWVTSISFLRSNTRRFLIEWFYFEMIYETQKENYKQYQMTIWIVSMYRLLSLSYRLNRPFLVDVWSTSTCQESW